MKIEILKIEILNIENGKSEMREGKYAEKHAPNFIVMDLRKDFHICKNLPYFWQYVREILE